ncbi:MAG: hypothetical protein RJA07_2552 [Bacteroidota bacterium]|jgi:O-antigen/teichoic acid export membrane protein
MKKDILIYFIGKLLPMLVNLSVVVLGVRYLGKAEYGQFSLIYSSLFTFFMLCFGWVQQGILRFYTEQNFSKSKTDFFFSVSFWMSVLLMLLMILITLLYFKLPILISILIGSTSFLFTMLFYFLAVYQSKIDSKKYALTESAFYVLWFVFSALLITFSIKNYWLGFVAMFTALLIVVSFQIWINRDTIKILSIKFLLTTHSLEIKKLLSYGLPIAIWLFLSSTFNFADRFIIQHYYGYADAGIYSTVYDLFFKVATFACMPILLANHSRIVNEWNAGNVLKSWSVIKISILLEIVMMIFSTIFIYVIGGWALENLTNIKLDSFNYIALPILAASFIWQIGMFVHKPLELFFKQWYMIIAVVSSLLINVCFNLFFIPKYKFEAAAISTLIGTLVYVLIIIVIIYLKKYHKLSSVENKKL